jgi:hypothetical protein
VAPRAAPGSPFALTLTFIYVGLLSTTSTVRAAARFAVCSRVAAATAAAKVSDINFFAVDFIELLPFGIKYKFKKFEHFLINGHFTNWCAISAMLFIA